MDEPELMTNYMEDSEEDYVDEKLPYG